MSELSDVNLFISASRSVVDTAGLSALIEAIAREMGFEWFSLMQLNMGEAHGRRSLISITNYPVEWIEELTDSRLYEADPAYLASCRTSVGFKWSEIGTLIRLGTRQQEVLQRASRMGLVDGFTVPAHVPGESNGLSTFVVGRNRALPTARLPMAQLVGAFAYEAARRLRGTLKGDPTVKLTSRQTDCVLQIARGKSDWEIGGILGISEETVSEHVDAARRRYGVARRSQLVVRALYDGLFSLTDAMR